MKFMRQVGDGEATLDSGKEGNANDVQGTGAIAGAWAREFADNWAEDFAPGEKSSSWEEEFGKKFGGKLLVLLFPQI